MSVILAHTYCAYSFILELTCAGLVHVHVLQVVALEALDAVPQLLLLLLLRQRCNQATTNQNQASNNESETRDWKCRHAHRAEVGVVLGVWEGGASAATKRQPIRIKRQNETTNQSDSRGGRARGATKEQPIKTKGMFAVLKCPQGRGGSGSGGQDVGRGKRNQSINQQPIK